MIIFMGGINMIIERLSIVGLHGVYDYCLDFNEDLTFIFGENGCGKTTILDIVTSIVTGKLYNLFRYEFEKIVLTYREERGRKRKPYSIVIEATKETYDVSIDGLSMHDTIEDIRKGNEMYSRDEDEYSYDRRFMSRYEIPRYLRKAFNYIYLPLSRNSQDGIDYFESISFRRRKALLYSEKDIVNKNYLNDSLRYVEDIVRTGCMRISSTENTINSQFRSNILTSSLKVTSEYDLTKLLSSVRDKKTLDSIEKNHAEYIKTLKSIGEWNNETNKRVDGFFKKYRSAFDDAQKEDGTGKHGVTIEFLLMNMEFNRIKEIAQQAQEIEKQKEGNRTPISAFLSTVNIFFNIGEDKKTVTINEEGKIIIETESPQRKLSLYNLSSGEKQIIILFACLIFGLPTGQGGIYIIDEPEASLHLAWQRIFVSSIRNVNDSIQLIFATHAPEIIGKFADCAVKLTKKTAINRFVEVYRDEEGQN